MDKLYITGQPHLLAMVSNLKSFYKEAYALFQEYKKEDLPTRYGGLVERVEYLNASVEHFIVSATSAPHFSTVSARLVLEQYALFWYECIHLDNSEWDIYRYKHALRDLKKYFEFHRARYPEEDDEYLFWRVAYGVRVKEIEDKELPIPKNYDYDLIRNIEGNIRNKVKIISILNILKHEDFCLEGKKMFHFLYSAFSDTVHVGFISRSSYLNRAEPHIGSKPLFKSVTDFVAWFYCDLFDHFSDIPQEKKTFLFTKYAHHIDFWAK